MLEKTKQFFYLLGSVILSQTLSYQCLTDAAQTSMLQEACGLSLARKGRIVGGGETEEGEFPWMATVNAQGNHFCGGFAISQNYILSAAHCFTENNKLLKFEDGLLIPSSVNVTVGRINIREDFKNDGNLQVEDILLHPAYDPVLKENDIALIKISDCKQKIQSICLPEPNRSQHINLVGKDAVVAGWGFTSYLQSYWDWMNNVKNLKKVTVKIWNSEECAKTYEEIHFPRKSFLCAGAKGSDSCRGDSGGPLMQKVNGKWIGIGIVAAGKACGELGKPGVYTDISEFIPWITSHMI